MSDKFFFKGRQDARQSHIKYGYEQKVSHKSGSEKYPLELVVTSEIRRQEVEALAADANLYSVVTLDTSEDAVESIETLTAILNKNPTVKVEQTPSRNEPCTCGSGKKYKKCCG